MIRALVCACLVLASSFAGAQRRPLPEYQMGILRFAAVQQELKMTTQQRAKVAAALDVAVEEFKKASKGGIHMDTVDRIYGLQRKALVYLAEPQKKRLREISLQVVGPYALTDDRTAHKLGMTTAQRGKLAATLAKMGEEARAESQKNHGPASDKDRQAAMRLMLKRQRQQLIAKTEAILTPAQLRKWRSMTGKPFDVSRLTAPP